MSKFLKQNWLKVIAVLLLIGAFGDHPYSYYQLLRWFVSIYGFYLAYNYKEKGATEWMWIFTSLAILFNPIFPFYFEKSTWQILDLLGGGIFLLAIFKNKK